MNVIKFSRVALLACILSAGAAHATVLTLPGINSVTATAYNDFSVYSMNLLSQCASNPLCQPTSGELPPDSSPGQIDDQAVILTGAMGNQVDNFNTPWPYPNNSPHPLVDDSLQSKELAAGSFGLNDAGGQFTGDLADRWDISLGLLKAYLGNNELVFLFDNNQTGNTAQSIKIWGQARIKHTDNSADACFEVSTRTGGCGTATAPTSDSDYVDAVSDFCVSATTGLAYPSPTGNSNGCAAGDYWVVNNISTAGADFAAYNKDLNDAVKNGNDSDILSIDLRYLSVNAGNEQLWICSQCNISDTTTRVPEPGTPFLIGVSLLGLAVARRLPRRGA
ncbi:PEP-CTERM sorting domain-containing protein [Pseudoduganella sp. LjRoot289]|uniref:PEP-CTERM sorting domain-containing protein n=1 Tax=Pseudoduganella sp. LjRoot289 TaxID=3342314 RepID=UPI003ED0C77A